MYPGQPEDTLLLGVPWVPGVLGTSTGIRTATGTTILSESAHYSVTFVYYGIIQAVNITTTNSTSTGLFSGQALKGVAPGTSSSTATKDQQNCRMVDGTTV